MFDLNEYLENLISSCKMTFGERLLYVGLQGSRQRGEANEHSDVDVMVILDQFSVKDMDTYREILKKIGYYDMSCGFICGREEMLSWSPLETTQLRYTTRDLLGALSDYLAPATRKDEVEYVKFNLGNIYHELCHRYIHGDREKNISHFRGTCKHLFFLIQNLYYLETGLFVPTKRALLEAVSEEDREILQMAELPDGFDFDEAFGKLFLWCRKAFARVDQTCSPVRFS